MACATCPRTHKWLRKSNQAHAEIHSKQSTNIPKTVHQGKAKNPQKKTKVQRSSSRYLLDTCALWESTQNILSMSTASSTCRGWFRAPPFEGTLQGVLKGSSGEPGGLKVWRLEAPFKPPSSPLHNPFKPPSSPLRAPFKPPWSPLHLEAPLKPAWSPVEDPLKPPWIIEWLGGGSWPWASVEKMALRYGWGVAEVRLSQWYTFESNRLSISWVCVEYTLSTS